METRKEKSFYPVLIDISEKKCLVVGGGNVALRKVKNLMDFDAHVTIISPKLTFELENLVVVRDIEHIERGYQAGDSAGYDLVFCTTDDTEVNRLVVSDCKMYGALTNIADSPDQSAFIIPATIKRGELTISVAAQGKAPFFVKHIKEQTSNKLPELLEKTVALAIQFRSRVLADSRFQNPDKKKEILDKFLREDWEKIIREKGMDEVYLRMAEMLK